MNAELQWKRLQAQQAAVEERSAKLEEEVSKLRSNAEVMHLFRLFSSLLWFVFGSDACLLVNISTCSAACDFD